MAEISRQENRKVLCDDDNRVSNEISSIGRNDR